MTVLPSISSHDRYWNAEIARRRPDLVSQEAGPVERMIDRYYELAGSTFGTVATVLTDRARVIRHLIDRHVANAPADAAPASEAGRHLTAQVGSGGAWTEPQAE